MNYRRYNSELAEIQENLRKELLSRLCTFDVTNMESFLGFKKWAISETDRLIAVSEANDKKFFSNYKLLLASLFHLLEWGHKEISGIGNGETNLNASKSNIELLDLNWFDYIPEFRADLEELKSYVISVTKVKEIGSVVDRFLQIPFPTIHSFEVDPYARIRGNKNRYVESEKESNVVLLSVQFTVDSKPWANPQILKPEILYTIRGKISLNRWPDGFDTLALKPVSTSSNEWFNLSIPEITKSSRNEYDTKGQVVFKYPQNSFDEPISIRLLAYFQNQSGGKEYHTIIGYDQLIAKVLDPSTTYFPTGFKSMDYVVFNIVNSIEKELPNIVKEEKTNFLRLLSGIVSYQGFCMQQGTYREQKRVLEDTFRDNLIAYLVAQPDLGEHISKEAHLAGGRVEINYKGIIAELKVEGKISDRQKLFEKYAKQPVAYASGNTKQLSILCILELTEKKLPPASPQNNVTLLTQNVHGFEKDTLKYPSKVVVVVIDGNTKKPSEYSK